MVLIESVEWVGRYVGGCVMTMKTISFSVHIEAMSVPKLLKKSRISFRCVCCGRYGDSL